MVLVGEVECLQFAFVLCMEIAQKRRLSEIIFKYLPASGTKINLMLILS